MMDKVGLYTQIQSLKTTKKMTVKDSCALELIRVTGYVNIIDMLLFPLYYTWEYSKYGTLDEVGFETYLKKSYVRFCYSPKRYTRIIVVVLNKAFSQGLSPETQTIIESLIKTYSIKCLIR